MLSLLFGLKKNEMQYIVLYMASNVVMHHHRARMTEVSKQIDTLHWVTQRLLNQLSCRPWRRGRMGGWVGG